MRVALALTLLLLAAPAFGDVVYVPEDPPDTEVGSYAVGADTIYLAVNSYTTTLTPPSAGTEERPIVWIGQGEGVTFAAIAPKSHNRFYNLRITAGVDMPANGKHVMFDGCSIGGSLNFKDADSSSVRNCRVNGTKLTVGRNISGVGLADADTLESCTFDYLNSSDANPGMVFGDNADPTGSPPEPADSCRYFVQRFNRFTITQAGSYGSTASKHYMCPNFTSYANTYVINSTITSSFDEFNYGVLFRDCSYNLRMKRDIILVNNEGSTQSHYGLMFTDGTAGHSETNQNSTVDSCYIRVFRGSGIWLKTPMPSLKMRYNVVRSRLGTALEVGTGYQASANDPYIHHNTLMGKQAVYFSEYANNGGGFSHNILWGTSTQTCDAYQAVGGTTGNLTSFSDSNLVYSTTGDSTRALCKTACNSPRKGAWSTTYSNDTHSYWANPDFADTSWNSLNVAPHEELATFAPFSAQPVGASDGNADEIPVPDMDPPCPCGGRRDDD